MGVGRERQPEMAEPLGRVARLHLGAQQLLHDLLAPVAVADPLDDPVEGAGLDHLAERELDPEGLEIILERDQLLAARRLVDAVHDRRLLRFERARGGDVGGDHVILDQPVRVEPVARRDRHDPPLLVEHHPALGQIELERVALLPRREQRAPAGPQRLQRFLDQFPRHAAFDRRHVASRRRDLDPLLARRVHRRLRIFVGDVRRDANLRARETPAFERSRPWRSSGGRPSPRGPRLPSASRCRPTAPRAASARRGRGNRRCCRAPAPRGRARSRGGRRS